MRVIWRVLCLAFGAFFIWSGVAKVKNPIAFADAVRNYEIVGDPFAVAIAHFLPLVEVFAGVFVMLGILRRGGMAVLLGCLVVFNVALCLAWIRGLDITCGCFGGTEKVNYPIRVGMNFALIALGFIILNRLGLADSEGEPAS